MMVVMISNAKCTPCGPFIYQDFSYFIDALLTTVPPFLGLDGRSVLVVAFSLPSILV